MFILFVKAFITDTAICSIGDKLLLGIGNIKVGADR